MPSNKAPSPIKTEATVLIAHSALNILLIFVSFFLFMANSPKTCHIKLYNRLLYRKL